MEAGNYLIAYADVVVFFVWFPMTSSVHRALQKSHLDPFLSVFAMAAPRKNSMRFVAWHWKQQQGLVKFEWNIFIFNVAKIP